MVKRPDKCPCYDCKERYAGCHSECERYKTWAKETQEFNSAKRSEIRNSVYEYSKAKQKGERL